MTAPKLRPCLNCGEGVLREDPQTGDRRCGNCGSPPIVAGGQGRTGDEVREAAVFFAIAFFVLLAGVTVIYVAARCGWIEVHP